MKPAAPTGRMSMLQCASFGDGCSFLVSAESGPGRDPFGDVVADPEAGSSDLEGCPECGDELVGVGRSR